MTFYNTQGSTDHMSAPAAPPSIHCHSFSGNLRCQIPATHTKKSKNIKEPPLNQITVKSCTDNLIHVSVCWLNPGSLKNLIYSYIFENQPSTLSCLLFGSQWNPTNIIYTDYSALESVDQVTFVPPPASTKFKRALNKYCDKTL